MSEPQADYITEAMELLNGTTLEISSPEKVIERRDGKLVEVERSAFVKIFTSFKKELKTISGDELKVWLYLALSINRFSKTATPGLRKIAEDTGLAVNTVRGIIERLELSQLLDVEKADGKGNQYRPADYASVSKFDTVPQTVSNSDETVSILEPTVSTLRGENAQLELTRNTREALHFENPILKGIEASIYQGRTTTQEDMNASNKPSWKGREMVRDNLLPFADWYHNATGQVMSKSSQKSWHKALRDWQDEGVTPAHLQVAFEAQSKWRMVSDPNQLTKDAAAVKASGIAKENTSTVEFDADGTPASY